MNDKIMHMISKTFGYFITSLFLLRAGYNKKAMVSKKIICHARRRIASSTPVPAAYNWNIDQITAKTDIKKAVFPIYSLARPLLLYFESNSVASTALKVSPPFTTLRIVKKF